MHEVLLFLCIGIFSGVFTGLIPGIHVNNVALIALMFVSFVSPLPIAVWIVTAAVTHTFIDFIPSTLLGAPDEDTVLSLLPMHDMVLEGRGYEAIAYSAIGSLGAVLLALILFIPFKMILGTPLNLYENIEGILPFILILIVSILIYIESRKGLKQAIYAGFILLLSGFLGWVVFNTPLLNLNYLPFKILQPNLLFPLFTGLFGISTLLLSLEQFFSLPEQKIKKVSFNDSSLKDISVGTMSGAFTGFLPGVSSGIAAVISRIFVKESKRENFIVTMGSINTANMMFNLAALFIILRTRSGAIKAVDDVLYIQQWDTLWLTPIELIILMVCVLVAALVAYPLTLFLARFLVSKFEDLNYQKLVKKVLILLFVMIFLFTGVIGIVVALVAIPIGLLPPKLGIARVHLMGVLLIPTILVLL